MLYVIAIWLCFEIMPFQVGLLGSAATSETTDDSQLVDHLQLTASIHQAAAYLVKQCNHNGKFL